MTDNPRKQKEEALRMLQDLLPGNRDKLSQIDYRMVTYYEGLLDGDVHNLFEILAGIKFLRILRTYPFYQRKVAHAIRLYEGLWENDKYIEKSGGLMFSGLKGFTHYQLQPFQVFALAGLLGPHKDVDGDMRRLCTELVLYLTRKSGKTLMAAFINFYGFFFFDVNYEGYCTANSSDQAKILYRTSQALIRQMDPQEKRIRFTASQTNWKVGQPRQASFTALSAGGKTKDGLFAQACFADEFGSADFVNGKSDMKDLVSVVQSSMGPRREPLTVITTTAGYAVAGPFYQQKTIMENTLLEELTLPMDYDQPRQSDYQHALLLQPDVWEQTDEEALLTDEKIWRKSNPMIGISVQPEFYAQEAYKARMNPDNRKEFVTKLVNVYQTNTVTEWIKPDKIRSLQVDMRIDDCTANRGWVVFVGCDFSQGNDLNVLGYLAYNRQTGRFLADTDAWVSRQATDESPVRDLYERWQEQGWMTIVPGETFDPTAVVNRIADLTRKGVDIWRIGYDPYGAAIVINALSAFVADLGKEPKQFVVPVRQTYATYNGAVDEFDHMVRNCDQAGQPDPWVKMSMSPLLPWEFGNCVLDYDRMENKKPVKRNASQACKVDSVQAILSALLLFDAVDGQESKE